MAATHESAHRMQTDSIPMTDLEAGPHQLAEPALTHSETEPPEYKAHDMEEPLPPYMARVKQVYRREQPISAAMPSKRGGLWIVGFFVLAVIIVIGVGVGVRVSQNNDNNNNKNNAFI